MLAKFRNIEAERVRLGMTQQQFVEKLNTTCPTYRKKINGKSAFSANQLTILRELTGKSIDYLLVSYTKETKH